MMVVKFILVSVLGLIVITCAQKAKEPAGGITPPQTALVEPGKLPWQMEWEKALTGARKEGRVVLYTSGGTEGAREPIRKAIKDRFNLEIEMTTARGALISAKLQTERRAGIYMADVYLGAAKRLLQTDKPTGSLDPMANELILPEVLDKKAWWGEQLRWIDSDRTVFAYLIYVNTPIVINTNLVRPDEIKSYKDLLDPKWNGKIVMDDPRMGGGTASIIFALGEGMMGWDFVRQLARQNPVIITDRRLILDWTAKGKYPISMMTTGVDEFIKAGAPVMEIIPGEGTYLATGPGSVALINKAPHPDAARLFINWLLSKEGQTVFSQATGYPSARIDAPKDMFDPRLLPQPGVKYFSADNEEYLYKRIKFEEEQAKEIFSHLLR